MSIKFFANIQNLEILLFGFNFKLPQIFLVSWFIRATFKAILVKARHWTPLQCVLMPTKEQSKPTFFTNLSWACMCHKLALLCAGNLFCISLYLSLCVHAQWETGLSQAHTGAIKLVLSCTT